MGHNQANVKELYLRVIQNTIDRSRAAFEENDGPNEDLSGKLERLGEQWRTRVLENHDFTDDPTAVLRGTAARAGSAAAKKAAAAAAAASAAAAEAAASGLAAAAGAQHGGPTLPGGGALGVLPGQQGMSGRIPLPGHLGVAGTLGNPNMPPAATGAAALPGVPRFAGASAAGAGGVPAAAKVEPTAAAGSAHPPANKAVAGNGADGVGPSGEPPAKRARRAAEEEVVNDNEDLGSADSDDDDSSAAGSDGNAENYILAQNDSVKKGGGNGKWKVRLKDGILHLNGRDYLFSKANCDLDW